VLSTISVFRFRGQRFTLKAHLGAMDIILMLHGGGKDRTVFYKYRDLLRTLGLWNDDV
jgi:hypothetical protein